MEKGLYKPARTKYWAALAAALPKPGGTPLIGECYIPRPMRAAMNVPARFSPDGNRRFYRKRELYTVLDMAGAKEKE